MFTAYDKNPHSYWTAKLPMEKIPEKMPCVFEQNLQLCGKVALVSYKQSI